MRKPNIMDIRNVNNISPEAVLKLETEEERRQNEKGKKRKVIIVAILVLLLLIGFNVGEMLNSVPTRPGIKSKSNGWGQKNLVEVEKESKAKNGIKYYLYCISADKSDTNCKWEKTYTKDVEIKEDGTYYVFFKGVSNDGSISKASEPEEVKIDKTSPEILKSEITSTYDEIKVKVVAKDDGSGIDKYYFKLDNGNWIENDSSNYTFTGLIEDTLYKVYVKVVDKVGNEKIIELSIKTKKKEEVQDKKETNNNSNNTKTNTPNNNPSENNNDKENKDDKENKTEEIPPATPLINVNGNLYPVLSNYEILDNREVSIIYDTNQDIKNYYSYDGENWKLYTGPFVPINNKVYAKSINNKSNLVSQSEKEVIPSDIVPKTLYDNNFDHIDISSLKNKYMEIADNMIGHYIGLSWQANSDDLKVNFYNVNKELISSISYDTTMNEDTDAGVEYAVITSDGMAHGLQIVRIPENAKYFSFNNNSDESVVNEIIPYKGTILGTQDGNEKVYPHMTKTGVIEKTKLSIIDKFGGDLMYMTLDDQYTMGAIEFYQGDDIEIPAYNGIIMIREDDKYTYYSGLVTKIAEDAVPYTVYDGNINRGVIISIDDHNNGDDRILKLDDLTGYQLSVSWEPDITVSGESHIYLVFKNEDGIIKTEDLSTTNNSLITSKVDIPNGAKEVSIYTTAQKMSLYEISALPIVNSGSVTSHSVTTPENSYVVNKSINNPVINISDYNNYSITKEVTINYSSNDYEKQYSYDAEKWYNYTGPITVSTATTIYARQVGINGEILAASSYKITKISGESKTQSSISLDNLPNEIEEGTNLELTSLITTTNFDAHSKVCYVDNQEVINTNSLAVGEHSVNCSVTSSDGQSLNITKLIKVIAKENNNSQNEGINSNPNNGQQEPNNNNLDNNIVSKNE